MYVKYHIPLINVKLIDLSRLLSNVSIALLQGPDITAVHTYTTPMR